MAKKFFNLHRHSPAKDLEESAIVNISPGDGKPEGCLYSVGVHPWHISGDSLESDLELVLGKGREAAAIGECGLDRACNFSVDLQMEVFRRQIGIAGRLAKPMILHCVRAYPEIISERKKHARSAPWIIHGFRGGAQTVAQLVSHGFYISCGKDMFKDERGARVVSCIPADRLFLETDDTGSDVADIYRLASERLNIGTDELAGQICSNALKALDVIV